MRASCLNNKVAMVYHRAHVLWVSQHRSHIFLCCGTLVVAGEMNMEIKVFIGCRKRNSYDVSANISGWHHVTLKGWFKLTLYNDRFYPT